jgi:uncharacterized cupredoxin-like copper-binding protein
MGGFLVDKQKTIRILGIFLMLCVILAGCGTSDNEALTNIETSNEEQVEEPATEEPAAEEPAKEEPVKEEPAKAEPAKAEPAKVEPAKAEPAKVEPAKVEPAKAEPAKAEPAKAEPAAEEPATKEETSMNQMEISIEISAVDLAYKPEHLTVKKDQTVTLIFKNEGKIFHDWVIDKMPIKTAQTVTEHNDDGHHEHGEAYAVHVSADSGKQSQVTFIPTATGKYTFYCSIPGHKDAGMIGTIEIIN